MLTMLDTSVPEETVFAVFDNIQESEETITDIGNRQKTHELFKELCKKLEVVKLKLVRRMRSLPMGLPLGTLSLKTRHL